VTQADCVLNDHIPSARPEASSNAAPHRQTPARGIREWRNVLGQLRQDVALPGFEKSGHIRADLLHVHFVDARVDVFA